MTSSPCSVRSAPWLCLLGLGLLHAPVYPQPAPPPPLRDLDAYVEAAMRDWQVPGLALAVVRGDSVLYARGYGVLELGRPERVNEHTLFSIASTTKAMTVAALGMLVDAGVLSWDDSARKWLPELELSDPYVTRELTVRDLLTHRAGIAREDNLWLATPFDRAEVLRRARFLPQVAPFRARYGYHNILYLAAGEVVGRASGTSWDDFLAERLFAPLGMSRSTTRTAEAEARGNVASPHRRDGGEVRPALRRNYDNVGGAGGAFSSASDMARWLRLHLNRGVFEGRRILREETLEEMYAPHNPLRADSVARRMFPGTLFRAYALGWNVQDYRGRRLLHHSGTLNYTRTHVGFMPEEGIGVVAMANVSPCELQLALMYWILDALLGAGPDDWSRLYLEVSRRGWERSAEEARRLEESRMTGTSPSLPLEAYGGTYGNDLYGDMKVELENGRLVFRYFDVYTGDLEHWHHDIFRIQWRHPDAGRSFARFQLDERGRITGVEVNEYGVLRRRVGR